MAPGADPGRRRTAIAIGITGASGAVYAARTVAALLERGVRVELIVSDYGRRLLRDELGEHAPHLGAGRGDVLDVADAERDRDRVDRRGRGGDARRVAADERHAIGKPGARDLPASDAQHRAGEIDADHARRGRPRAHRRDREVGGAGAEIEHPLAAGERERPDRALAPPRVDAGAEQMVQEVVPRRDRVEHPGNALGRLGDISHGRGTSAQRTIKNFEVRSKNSLPRR